MYVDMTVVLKQNLPAAPKAMLMRTLSYTILHVTSTGNP